MSWRDLPRTGERVAITLFLALALACSGSRKPPELGCTKAELASWRIPADWLVEQVTAEAAEADNLRDGIPFGLIQKEWKALLARRKPSDELWFYDSKENTGMAGYALIRDCGIVDNVITAQYE